MARPQKDVVSYFPHDADASTGDTLTVLQSRFGNDGYAFWFKLLEKLASTDGHFLDVSKTTKWHLLLAKTGVNEITGVEIMNLLVEMQAVDKELWDSKLIWCQKLVDNVADVYRNRRREIPQRPVSTNRNGKTTEENGITTDDGTQSKVKEIKVYKNKGNAEKAWGKALELLSLRVSKANYRTWFSKTTGLGYLNGRFVVGVPNEFTSDYLEKNQHSLVEEALLEILQQPFEVIFAITDKEPK